MARKISVMTEQIVQAAFELTEREGFAGVTARKLAGYLGCSTQPIFRAFHSMDELYDEIYERTIKNFSDFCDSFTKTDELPFINLGLAYIAYADARPQFFRILFLEEKRCGKGLYELLNGSEGNLMKEINRAAADGVKDPGDVFMKMWIFIHGAACMVITKDYDLSVAQTRQMLRDSYHSYAGVRT